MSEALVEFLRARLEQDEASAKAASPGPWRPSEESDEVLAVDGVTVADGFALSGRQLRATTEHIARHDPARVLAEVGARRHLIELHQERLEQGYGTDFCAECGFGEVGRQYYPCQTLRLLALPYADHPDYQERWRP
ncbi:DUF6221 family protein [Streptomyces sp. NPDC006975]|uniref:DUF6221 family protein n=1 Tax=Streptomyces sp. NPDC006975 TaxID=3154310 RepID=UPI0034561EE9